MDYEKIENNCLKICNDIAACNPGLKGAALFDAITGALPKAGVTVNLEATAALRVNSPNAVAVCDFGDDEPGVIFRDVADFRFFTYDPDDNIAAPYLISEDEAGDVGECYYDNPERARVTAADLGDLRYIIRDGVKLFDEADIDYIREQKKAARAARFAEQRTVSFDLPDEFLLLCDQYGLTPAQALRGFVADVCDITSYAANPRQDGYSSNGSDERGLARAYFDRAHWHPEIQEKYGIGLTTW